MLTIVIQAGGESRRMGQNKALVPFLGCPLIERVIGRLAPLADELVLTSNEPEGLAYLGLPIFADIYPGRGALGGLYTALSAATQAVVAVVACDMPFVNRDVLAMELSLLMSSGADVVIPDSGEGLEPLHAIYRRRTCLPAVAAALSEDRKRLISWFPAVRVVEMPVDAVRDLDERLLTFLNVNTPEDLVQAEVLAQRYEAG